MDKETETPRVIKLDEQSDMQLLQLLNESYQRGIQAQQVVDQSNRNIEEINKEVQRREAEVDASKVVASEE